LVDGLYGSMDKPKPAHDVSSAIETARKLSLEGAFGFLFRRLNSLSNTLFLKDSGQSELTAMQAGILLTIYQEETLSLRELARRMYVDRSTMQEVVNRLVARKLIARRVPESDRRTYELSLTAKGCETVLRHAYAMAGLQTRLLEGIDPEKAKLVKDVLHQILEHHGS
jgi:DNA-binding MarR family transcriptional regulator